MCLFKLILIELYLKYYILMYILLATDISCSVLIFFNVDAKSLSAALKIVYTLVLRNGISVVYKDSSVECIFVDCTYMHLYYSIQLYVCVFIRLTKISNARLAAKFSSTEN